MPTDSSISPAKPETAKGTDKDQDDNQDQDDRKNQDDKKDQDDNTDKDRPKNKNKNKNKNKSTMHIPDSALVVVRIQQSRGLEDALRVHLSPESLDAAGLAIGDPCEVNNEDGTVTAYGIAWRAEDRMNATRPKNRPIKVTETLRDLFDLKEGSRVTISRTRASLQPASKIMLTDVSPVSHNKSGVPEETCWKYDIGSLFSHSDAIAPGITFEITGKKKCRRRFYIEHVEGSIPGSNSCLYIMTDDTQIILPGDR
jgi:AAA family ATPase